MKDLTKNPLFEEWIDPISGVKSYLLKKKIAPLMQSFYFSNNSLTKEGRYLWFYCAFPPSGDAYQGRMLGILDLVKNEMTYFPETQFGDLSPVLDEVTGEIYWVSGTSIYKRGPLKEDCPVLVAKIPDYIVKNRTPHRVTTHLTFSADHRHLNVDAQIGREWFIGDVNINNGEFTLWQKMDVCYNHGQFSPIDNELQLISQDWWYDCCTGEETFFKNRIWLIRKGEKAKPIYEGTHNRLCHEWWSSDGRKIMYVDYDKGTYSYNIATSESKLIWPGKPCHSHCNKNETLFVGDVNDYTWATDPCKVLFYDTMTGKEIAIVSDMKKPEIDRRWYHTDPHPRFIADDEYILYTTTEAGMFTLAVTKVQDILELM